jgi:uncharacterized protein YbaP (TraB family)
VERALTRLFFASGDSGALALDDIRRRAHSSAVEFARARPLLLRGAGTFLGGVLFLAAAACGAETPAPATTATPFLWRVEGAAGHGWLYGTMHVSEPRAVRLPAAVEAALSESAALYTEIEGGLAATTALLQAGNLPPTTTLPELLPPELHQRMVAYLEARQLGMREFDGFQPWLATMMLGQIDAMELLRAGPPLDEFLRRRAAESGVRLGALETVEEQITAIASGSAADQIHLLDVTLTRLEEDRRAGRKRLMELYEAWLRGDEPALLLMNKENLDLNDPAQARWWEQLFTLRNQRMAERADRVLREAGNQPIFFALGTLHFLGENSVVELLRARGWSVVRAD